MGVRASLSVRSCSTAICSCKVKFNFSPFRKLNQSQKNLYTYYREVKRVAELKERVVKVKLCNCMEILAACFVNLTSHLCLSSSWKQNWAKNQNHHLHLLLLLHHLPCSPRSQGHSGGSQSVHDKWKMILGWHYSIARYHWMKNPTLFFVKTLWGKTSWTKPILQLDFKIYLSIS